MGGGGYVSWAPVFLAALSRRPTLIIELDSYMGLANRALAPLATRVALCFDIPGRRGGKYIHTGRPLRRNLLEATAKEGRREFGLSEDTPVVLVTGGSQGARTINEACVGAFGRGRSAVQVVHVSGRRDYEEMKRRLSELRSDPANYHLLDYTEKLPLAMSAADLVVSRAGASVQELAALGKPAILVPYPYATADHQRRNAEWMATAGAAEIIPDTKLDAETLKSSVDALLGSGEKLAAMAAASAKLGDKSGAERIAGEIFKISR